jgi:hypothetical protein
MTNSILGFHFEVDSEARGVTDPGVGCSGLLGLLRLVMSVICTVAMVKRRPTLLAEIINCRVQGRGVLLSPFLEEVYEPKDKPEDNRSRSECDQNSDCGIHASSLPNVIGQPRRELARRVRHDDLDSVASSRDAFGSTRRDRSRRWLYRLVRPFFASDQK